MYLFKYDIFIKDIEAFVERERERLSAEDRVSLANLFNYFRMFWIARIGPNRFCVGGEVHRTDNLVEAFHRVWNVVCQSHPNFWSQLCKIAVYLIFLLSLIFYIIIGTEYVYKFII